MKKSFSIIALGALVLLASCDRSKATPDVTTFDLTVLAESAGTRATVNGTTGAFAWEAGDQIAIHLNSDYQSATLTAAGTTTLAAAAGSVRDGYAIFPASVAAGTASAPRVTLPLTYDIQDNLSSSSAKLPMIAVNDPDSDILYFHHVGGLMRITVASIPAGTQSVKVTLNNRQITGDLEVSNPGTATPTVSTTEGTGHSEVTFTVSSAGLAAAASDVVLNLPVPCGTYTSLTVDVIPSQSPFPKTVTDNMVIARADGLKIRVMP